MGYCNGFVLSGRCTAAPPIHIPQPLLAPIRATSSHVYIGETVIQLTRKLLDISWDIRYQPLASHRPVQLKRYDRSLTGDFLLSLSCAKALSVGISKHFNLKFFCFNVRPLIRVLTIIHPPITMRFNL